VLDLIEDHRTGQRLEIVVPTYNEEHRIVNLLRYYGERFDLVLLDDGSQDGTVPLALAAGATVFRRQGKVIGDSYFAYYANELSQSQMCFYLFADEFISRSNLEAIEQVLREEASVVRCDKAEWVYGHQMRTLNHLERRGFRKGSLQYNPDRLHEALQASEQAVIYPQRFALQHLHIWSVRNFFGKVGLYTYTEVEQFRRNPHAFRRFFRRYVVSWLGFPFLKAWREKGLSLPRIVFWFLVDLAELVIATLNWLEQKFLMSVQDQLDYYATFYQPDNSGS
jgi:glycosyltransferase involved in cell wall biosynthesis